MYTCLYIFGFLILHNMYSGMICPITTEQITKNHKDMDTIEAEWQTVFLIASSIHAFGVIFYACFASGEVSTDWAFYLASLEYLSKKNLTFIPLCLFHIHIYFPQNMFNLYIGTKIQTDTK